ncbi:MAG: apolipoprotein N-acyltransferase [Bryobacteraceae bacterium]|nr:apolipoprotein N-acyltransferase [Bryobacteraceae bacterium]
MRPGVLSSSLALLSSVLLVLAFPHFDLSWLATIALAPWLVALAREESAWKRFGISWLTGIVYWFGVCYWIQFVMAYHGGMGEAAGWGVFLLFCLAKGLHFAVFGWLAGYVVGRWWSIPVLAALWTGIERTHGPLGFAWLTLGNAGADMSLPLRLAPLVGVYGLSFLFVMMSASLAAVLTGRPRRELLWLSLLLLLFVLPDLPEHRRGTNAAVLLQPNIDQELKWTTESHDEIVQRLTLRSLQSALGGGPERKPEFIVWPEVPAPFYYENPRFQEVVNDLARTAAMPALIGVVGRTQEGSPLNSAVMVSPNGTLVDRYDKMFLVPFGEFVPFPFKAFIEKISTETGDFTQGARVVSFPLPGGQKAGAFICYESAFPHLVRQFALAGGTVLVNMSNDGYFGRTAAREQHLKLVRMRAAENRRWTLRATNDGITATIDPAGRLVQRLQPYIEVAARTRFQYVAETTPYTRYGDWFAWTCLAAGIGAVAKIKVLDVIRRHSHS